MLLSPNSGAGGRKFIIGLGNPGPPYARNRHNVGSQCLDIFARRQEIALSQRIRYARVGQGMVDGHEIILAIPRTPMNESGEAVSALVRRFKISPPDLVVIYDDLDLPVGKIRLRARGSPGGHKGMESIVARLGTKEFPRIRVGIGRPYEPHEAKNRHAYEEEVVRWVLSDFTSEEEAIIGKVRHNVAESILCLITQGIQAAMNRFN